MIETLFSSIPGRKCEITAKKKIELLEKRITAE
jgi:hypothetical protein